MKNQLQGDKLFQKGKNKITTGIFNWSKDYASAASYFDDAYSSFKKANSWKKCINTLNQLVICNKKLKDPWALAKNYENLSRIYMNQVTPIQKQKIMEYANQALQAYIQSQSTKNGLKFMIELSKQFNFNSFYKKLLDPDSSLQILKNCYQIALNQQIKYQIEQIFTIYSDGLLQANKIEQAAELHLKQIKRCIAKNIANRLESLCLQYTILCILIHQPMRANQQLDHFVMEVDKFAMSNELRVCEQLLKAYQQRDQQMFKTICDKAIIRNLYPRSIPSKIIKFVLPKKVKDNTTKDQNKDEEKEEGITTAEKMFL